MAQAYLLNTITNVLGLSAKQREVSSNDGYYNISNIVHWNYDDIHEWFTTKSKLKTTRGGSSYGDLKIKYIQALAWWATDLTFRGKHIDPSDFYDTIMVDFIDREKLD